MADGLAALAGSGTVTAAQVIGSLGLRERGAPAGRARLVAAMIASADGRAAVAGRSRGLGHPEDRALLRGLRGRCDAVLVGAATVRAERYANLLDEEHRAERIADGLPEQPVVGIVTRRGDVPWDVGLFAEPGTRVVVYTGSDVSVPAGVAAQVEVRPVADPTAVLEDLRARDGAELVLCEGGPRLLRAVAAAGVLDDLLLTVAPLLVAGHAPTLLSGEELAPARDLALDGVWRAGDHVFLHYRA